jgi:hypothetical protein
MVEAFFAKGGEVCMGWTTADRLWAYMGYRPKEGGTAGPFWKSCSKDIFTHPYGALGRCRLQVCILQELVRVQLFGQSTGGGESQRVKRVCVSFFPTAGRGVRVGVAEAGGMRVFDTGSCRWVVMERRAMLQ